MSNFSPSPSSTVQRPDIAMALAEYDLARPGSGNVGSQILPIQNVTEKFGNYGFLAATELAQEHDDIARAAGAGYKNIDFKLTQASYACQEYGVGVKLDAQFMQAYKYLVGGNADQFRMIAAAIAQNTLSIEFEKRVAAAVFNATTFASNTTAITNEWDDLANADPIEDINAAKIQFRAKFGSDPDTLVVSSRVKDNLRRNPDILALVSPTERALQADVTDAMLADALGLSSIVTGDSMRQTAAQGAAAPTFVDIWSAEYALLCKRANVLTPGGIAKPGLGRIFHWTSDGSMPMGMVETYWSDEFRCEVVRVRHDVQEKIEIVSAGWLLSNVTTL